MNASESRDAPRPKILCVDDEPNVLAALGLHLRRKYEVRTARSGADGLAVLRNEPDVAVLISDMRMPAMNGVAFLAQACDVAPDAVRVLLTGHADLDSAVSAVNEGRVFRFLTKPCVPTALLGAVDAAERQHRLVTAERELLESTVRGCIEALTDALSLTNPASFGRASRLRRLVSAIAARVALAPVWPVEVAAMLSQLGCIVLPPDTAERLYHGKALREAEQRMVERVPAVTERLLAHIPRIESVRGILACYERLRVSDDDASFDGVDLAVQEAARILRLASDFDELESRGVAGCEAIAALSLSPARYGAAPLAALVELAGAERSVITVFEVAVEDLAAGMEFAEDVRTVGGTLLVARGFQLTPALVERLQNLPEGSVHEPLLVRGPPKTDGSLPED